MHTSTATEQKDPDHPFVQVHEYEPMPSVHVAPLRHGDDTHSFTFTAQVYPAHALLQTHEKEATRSMHTPLCRHGPDAHSSISLRQVPDGESVYPSAQVQEYFAMPCVQVAPLRHGDDAHSLTLVAQMVPLKPAAHVQV